ncbi:hypothetical protein RhiirA4_419794 [Rhizophagus irregularis]|uniref:Uncharacterized protein n=1 Tax=Rhizophagus irregularis TaxID=588596 RepID=A0A2I1GFJ0_9GLOM|nr:hypothetical protein RhiirA4_419794 [Rhizophagus irregularis]
MKCLLKFQTFIDEKQQELLQKDQTIDKENSDNHQRNDESNIVCSNPVTSRRRGRPPNRYLSEGKTASKNKKQKMTIDLELQCISENNNNGNNKKVMIYIIVKIKKYLYKKSFKKYFLMQNC